MSFPLVHHRLEIPSVSELPYVPTTISTNLTSLVSSLWSFNLPIPLPSLYTAPYKIIANTLAATLEKTGATKVIQLCGGDSGALANNVAHELQPRVSDRVEITVTDPHPTPMPHPHLSPTITFHLLPVTPDGLPQTLLGLPAPPVIEPPRLKSAPQNTTTLGRRVGKKLANQISESNKASAVVRFMVGNFHTYSSHRAQMILKDAVKNGHGICIFDNAPVNAASLAFDLCAVPAMTAFSALTSPTPSRLFFTFSVPVLPFLAAVETITSALQSRSEQELQALIDGVEGNENYVWTIEKKAVIGPFWEIISVVGVPRG